MGLFSRKPKLPAAFSPSTGHPGDDQLLGIFAAAEGGFTAPRDFVHYVYCDTAEGAASLESQAILEGWMVRRVSQGEGIIANREDLPVNDTTVPAARAFFERIAAGVDGGEYDGWEASG